MLNQNNRRSLLVGERRFLVVHGERVILRVTHRDARVLPLHGKHLTASNSTGSTGRRGFPTGNAWPVALRMAALETEIEAPRPKAAARIGGGQNPRAASAVQNRSRQSAQVGKIK